MTHPPRQRLQITRMLYDWRSAETPGESMAMATRCEVITYMQHARSQRTEDRLNLKNTRVANDKLPVGDGIETRADAPSLSHRYRVAAVTVEGDRDGNGERLFSTGESKGGLEGATVAGQPPSVTATDQIVFGHAFEADTGAGGQSHGRPKNL